MITILRMRYRKTKAQQMGEVLLICFLNTLIYWIGRFVRVMGTLLV